MRRIVGVVLVAGVLWSQWSSAQIISFDCAPGVRNDTDRHTVDLDNKTWEWDDIVFNDVTVSANKISVDGAYKIISRKFVTIEISRVDLTYSFIRESNFGGIPQNETQRGKCAIVEDKVERAF